MKRQYADADKNRAKRTAAERLADALDMPVSALSNVARMEVEGNRKAVVDGVRGVLEYDEGLVRLDLGKISVRYSGDGLVLKSLNNGVTEIEGNIMMIEFFQE